MSSPDHPSPPPETWTCPSCGASAASPFCPQCGERRRGAHDLTLGHLLEQLLESLIHFDSRLFRTARVLVAEPGRLTVAFLTGRRRPYVSPFHIFLVANIIFFLVQVLSRLQVLTVPLDQELQHQVYSGFAQRLVTHHLAGTGMTDVQYAPIFEHAEALYAKSLIILMLPLFAVAAGLLFVDRRMVAAAHLVLAAHFYAFLMVALTVMFPAFALTVAVVRHVHLPLSVNGFDWVASSTIGLICLIYLAQSVAVVYGAGPVRRWLSAGVLTVATLYILYVYRFILLLVTVWAT